MPGTEQAPNKWILVPPQSRGRWDDLLRDTTLPSGVEQDRVSPSRTRVLPAAPPSQFRTKTLRALGGSHHGNPSVAFLLLLGPPALSCLGVSLQNEPGPGAGGHRASGVSAHFLVTDTSKLWSPGGIVKQAPQGPGSLWAPAQTFYRSEN